MPGEGEILLTGQLGDIMKESARAGISYIRSVSKEHGIDEKFFKEHDIHIHIPEGAVPKDGRLQVLQWQRRYSQLRQEERYVRMWL